MSLRAALEQDDEQRFEHLQQTDEALAALIQGVDQHERALESRVAALEAKPAPHPGPAWETWLSRLSSRRFQAFAVGVLTPIGALASGSLDPRQAVAAVIGAVLAYLASESYVDGKRAG